MTIVSSPSIDERRTTFRLLHAAGCFVIPNPWDIGSARILAKLRFPALATTSAGLAFSDGLPDRPTNLPLSRVLAHVADIVTATELPVSADFQAGYASDPEGVAESVRLCIETGVAGLSIEDASGNPAKPLFDIDVAVDRIRAARIAIDRSAADVVLTARAECFLVGHSDPLRESIRRLEAYAAAGADVLFAPGPRSLEQLGEIVRAVSPRPVNVIVTTSSGITVADLAALGVRRVSVGSALARVAWGGFLKASRQLASEGSFAGLADAAPFNELDAIFS